MIRKTRVARSISRYIKDGFVNRRPALPSLFSSIVISPMRFGKRAIILALPHHSILHSDLYPSLFFWFCRLQYRSRGGKENVSAVKSCRDWWTWFLLVQSEIERHVAEVWRCLEICLWTSVSLRCFLNKCMHLLQKAHHLWKETYNAKNAASTRNKMK